MEIYEIQNYANKFKTHPSILKIKEKNNITEDNDLFFFSIPCVSDTLIELENLNKSKPTTDNNITSKF